MAVKGVGRLRKSISAGVGHRSRTAEPCEPHLRKQSIEFLFTSTPTHLLSC